MTWVPLHVRSQFSILSSSASVQALVDRAKEWGLPAFALTDQGNLYGAVEFYKACKAAGIHPIIGCELSVAPQSRLEKKKIPGHPSGYPIVLLVKDREGYTNLCKLSSKGFLEGFYYTPRIDKELLRQHAKGLICLSGSLTGSIASLILQGKDEELAKEIEFYREIFGDDYYFEIQRHPLDQQKIDAYRIEQEVWFYQKMLDFREKEKLVEEKLKVLSDQWKIPLVATNDSRYLETEDWKAHEILVNILSGEPCEIWETDSHGNPKQRIPNPKRDVEPTLEYPSNLPSKWPRFFTICQRQWKRRKKSPMLARSNSISNPSFILSSFLQSWKANRTRRNRGLKQWKTISSSYAKKEFPSAIPLRRLKKCKKNFPGKSPSMS